MGESSDGGKIKRFKYCNPSFYSYIENVLLRLPEEICFQGFLDDLSFEIVSFDNNSAGRCYQFESQIKSLVVLNESILSLPECEIIYTVVHAIAQKIARKGGAELYEKEAEEFLVKWGFGKEVDETKYRRPILESEGYEVGYGWAKKQKDLSKFEEFYNEWNQGRLSGERLDKLLYIADTFSILYEMGCFEGKGVNLSFVDDFIEIPENAIFDNGSLNKGIIWGVMGFLKEKKRKTEKKIF